MNAYITPMNPRTFHPLRVNSDELHTLALWLKTNGPRQIRQPVLCSVVSQRYPQGLLSEDEVRVLCELLHHERCSLRD
ncbi:hypothetical protein AO262_10785 [Pseudomonas fluorescens ABAC62]|nr:hypothetical protein AO262_10785 [Pseudomonas fluorescens ABAC62]